jgi:hypothetical protein
MTTTRTHFPFRIDVWTANGESIVEHVAGVKDYELAHRKACPTRPNQGMSEGPGASEPRTQAKRPTLESRQTQGEATMTLLPTPPVLLPTGELARSTVSPT